MHFDGVRIAEHNARRAKPIPYIITPQGVRDARADERRELGPRRPRGREIAMVHYLSAFAGDVPESFLARAFGWSLAVEVDRGRLDQFYADRWMTMLPSELADRWAKPFYLAGQDVPYAAWNATEHRVSQALSAGRDSLRRCRDTARAPLDVGRA